MAGRKIAVPDRKEVTRCTTCHASGRIQLCCGDSRECRDCEGRGLVCSECGMPLEICEDSDCEHAWIISGIISSGKWGRINES